MFQRSICLIQLIFASNAIIPGEALQNIAMPNLFIWSVAVLFAIFCQMKKPFVYWKKKEMGIWKRARYDDELDKHGQLIVNRISNFLLAKWAK